MDQKTKKEGIDRILRSAIKEIRKQQKKDREVADPNKERSQFNETAVL